MDMTSAENDDIIAVLLRRRFFFLLPLVLYERRRLWYLWRCQLHQHQREKDYLNVKSYYDFYTDISMMYKKLLKFIFNIISRHLNCFADQLTCNPV